MKRPTDEQFREWEQKVGVYGDFGVQRRREIAGMAFRAGYEQGIADRPLWPDPITDRAPTRADHDDTNSVQFLDGEGLWRVGFCDEKNPWEGEGWQHTRNWQPRPPTLNELALAGLEAVSKAYPRLAWDNIRRALEAQQ